MTTLQIDFADWFADQGFKNGTSKTIYLVAKSFPYIKKKLLEMSFTKVFKDCWSDLKDKFSLNKVLIKETFNERPNVSTFDYAALVRTSNTNCPSTSLGYYFSTSNTSSSNETIEGVEFLASTTKFTVNPKVWLDRSQHTFPVLGIKRFYLVVESSPYLQSKAVEFVFQYTPDSLPRFTSAVVQSHSVTADYDSKYKLVSIEREYTYTTPRLSHPYEAQGTKVVVMPSFEFKEWLSYNWNVGE